MQTKLKYFFAFMVVVTLAACGGSASKDKKAEVSDMKVRLEKLKKERTGLDTEIKQLEDKLRKADPAAVATARKLVSADTLQLRDFSHYIELQGKIDADNMGYAAPTGMGGVVKSVHVKLGSRVGKGQLLLRLDDAVARQAVVAAQQQTGQIRARLTQAQTIYERYQNLWKQNIGAEINVINAKADVEALQSQLRAAEAGVRQAQEVANQSNVYAQISGVVDEMNVKVGQLFTPQTAGMPGQGIRIINNNSVKVVTEVPENYVTRVKKGDKVDIVVPETGRAPYNSVISVVGASIDPIKRSFITEAKLPSDPILKPNQTAVMRILDYQAKQTIAVPINVVQTDEKGKYVYIIEKNGDRLIARKKVVNVGEAYNDLIEIKGGLAPGQVIITEGYQSVYDGQPVLVSNK